MGRILRFAKNGENTYYSVSYAMQCTEKEREKKKHKQVIQFKTIKQQIMCVREREIENQFGTISNNNNEEQTNANTSNVCDI